MRRLLGIVLCASLAHLALWSACAVLSPEAEPALVPAAEGQITSLAIQFHRPGHALFLPVFGEILGALDEDTTVHVVVADAEDEDLFRQAAATWFSEGGPSLEFAHTDHAITSWMRDRLAVVDAGDHPLILAPDQPMTGPEARARDWTVPWTLGDHLDTPTQVSRFRFDGGDLIADSERVYVATPLMGRNPDLDPPEVLAEVEAAVGLPALWLGQDGRTVPNHHIGMFVAPLGDGRVVVGDPDLALEHLELSGSDVLSVGGRPLELDLNEERLDRFRHVADMLEEEGLEVIRAPVLPAVDDFVFLSYENVLMDTREDGLHVVLPVYGVLELDAVAVNVWESVGATVHPVDVSGIFRLGGSVRCLVAPVERA